MDKETLQNIEKKEWTKIWSGNWSFLSCFYFGERYSQILKVEGQYFSKSSIFLLSKGHSSGFIPEKERHIFGKHVVSVFSREANSIDNLALQLKKEVDIILSFIDDCEKREITVELFDTFLRKIDTYFIPHISVKYIVDFLPSELLKKKLTVLQEARVYAEPVFKRTEDLMRLMGKQIAKKTGYDPRYILSASMEEVIAYLTGADNLPPEAVLQNRYEAAGIVFEGKQWKIVTNKDLVRLEKAILPRTENGMIKGVPAFPGKVAGLVKIITDPQNASSFKEGDILVTGMTRPEYLPLMQKAAAFVTDAGGILSHAAIVAREMKKPCIIGTGVATKVLKDGDKIEVDAEKGVVKLLKA